MIFKKQEDQGDKDHYFVRQHGLLFIVYQRYYQEAFVSFWETDKDSEWEDEQKAHTHALILNESK